MICQPAIDRSDIEEAIMSGEIIEEYPDDKYSPSCVSLTIHDSRLLKIVEWINS
jgi:hypothetical protein